MLCMNTALELKTFKEFFTTDRDVDCVIISRLMTLVKTHHYTLFSLSHHYILSREWRVIAHQVQTNYRGRHYTISSQARPNCW